MTKSWRIDDFAPAARSFYQLLEQSFGASIYHPIDATRFCLNAEDAKRCQRRIRNPRYNNVLDTFQEAGAEGSDFADDYGSARIKGAAWVDLPEVLRVLREHYAKSNRLLREDFAHTELSRSQEAWIYQNVPYRGVVFCEGGALKANPWFGQLPLTPAKGETLLCESSQPPSPQKLVHHKKWFLPYEDGSFRIGATYDENNLNMDPTEQGKASLKRAFDHLKHEQTHPCFFYNKA